MPLFALAFVFGALGAFYGNSLPEPAWFAFWPLLLLLAWLLKPYRFLLVVAAAYLFSASVFYQSQRQQLPVQLHDQILTIQGKIDSLVRIQTNRITFLFSPLQGDDQPKLPASVRLSWYQDAIIPQPGSIWQLEVKLRPPRGLLNPGGFDYEKWLMVQGIGATGYVRNSDENQLLENFAHWDLQQIRNRLLQKLRAACSQCATIGLINGLAIGFRGDIDARHQLLLQATGTAHLLAISGLHVGLISMMFFWVGQMSWKSILWRLPVRCMALSSSMALTGAVIYSAMAGFSLPTQRALIFVAVIFIASGLRNRLNLLQCTAISIVVSLLLDPLAIGSTSFWLTLSALLVIGLTLFQGRQCRNRLQQLLLLQVNFGLLMSLPSLFIIGHFSLTSLPANLVAIPLISLLVLPMVFLSVILLLLGMPQIAGWLLQISDFCLHYLMQYLELLELQGLALVDGNHLPVWFILMVALGIFTWWLPFPNALRKLTWLVLLLLVQWRPEMLQSGEYRLTVLDSGLGNAIVVETGTHSLLYDFGPGRPGGYSTLDQVIKPFLGQRKFDELDLMVVSHVDHDHSGGFYAMAGQQRAHHVLLSGTPEKVKDRFQLDEPPRNCHEYPDWSWDGVTFSFLHAVDVVSKSPNNQSCVLLIAGHHKAMLPGDIEWQRERKLVEGYGEKLRADILISPHHGSKTSSTTHFINLVSPEAVVHTQSEANRWGFPHQQVVQRYAAIEARQYESGSHGAIEFLSSAEGLKTTLSRRPAHRIWR